MAGSQKTFPIKLALSQYHHSKGGRGKVFSPCRKLFKTEGFEGAKPVAVGAPNEVRRKGERLGVTG